MLTESPTPIQTSFLALPPEASILQATQSMTAARMSCVLVTQQQRLVGILTERDVVRLSTDPSISLQDVSLADQMTSDVFTVKETDLVDTFALLRRLSTNKIRHLPVLDEQDRVIGIVTAASLRELLRPEYLLRHVRVEEVYCQEILCGSPGDSLLMLAEQMAQNRVSCIVITAPNTCSPVGIVTERDIVKYCQSGIDFAKTPSQLVMSFPLSTMRPTDSLWAVHQRMEQLQVRRLVITEVTGELAGLVTQTQLLKILDPVEMHVIMEQMQERIDAQTLQLSRLNHQLSESNDNLEKVNEKLTYLSTIDELTQTANRRKLQEFLLTACDRLMGEDAKPLALLMGDVDHFKLYNDTYGHGAGDQCLRQVAQALKDVTWQASDLVARYGGEEFVVVLPDTDVAGAQKVAEKILAQVQGLAIPHIASPVSACVTVSLGIVVILPRARRVTEKEIFKAADELMYESKQEGRNTYRLRVLSAGGEGMGARGDASRQRQENTISASEVV